MDEDLRPLRNLIGEAMPQVNLYASTPGAHLTVVTGSHRHTIAAAVQHFRQIGVRSPAFLTLETGAGTVTMKRSIAASLTSFDPARDLLVHPVDIGVIEDPDACVRPVPKAILSWLAKLPRPAGVFCLQLGGGDYLLRLCRDQGLRVPEDICVIGMDDSDICLRSEPSLTSVMPVGEQVGHEGMRMLSQLMQTGVAQREVVRVEAVEVNIRRSTGRGVSLCDISAAMAFIDENACRGISVEDVRAHTQHASRMTFYKEFRRLTRRSPGEVIRERQLREARRLLSTSQLTVTQISTLCGFADGGTFTRMFRTAAGKTPSDYRRQVLAS
jgi:LacI family transcriptional regulator